MHIGVLLSSVFFPGIFFGGWGAGGKVRLKKEYVFFCILLTYDLPGESFQSLSM